MWGKTNEPKPPLSSPEPPAAPPPASFERPAPAPRAESLAVKTMLSRGVTLKGELSGSEDVCIDGEFEGKIRVSGAGVTIATNGRVTAEVEADEIVVEGRLEGSLRARQRLVIRRTAHVTGDIEAPRLAIEDGAVVRGRVDMPQAGTARSARPVEVPRAQEEGFQPLKVAASEAAR
jgi:cytoskeletal protein CcmA (bactofilin family)